jgi:tRNA A37 threonylcarbamoyladenosine biosynthesis protein TsaE
MPGLLAPATRYTSIQCFGAPFIEVKLLLSDEQATKRLAAEFGRNVDKGALLALCGELGTGKTVFVKALAASLGIQELVTSPTFVLMNEYSSGRLPLYHLDLYRVRESQAPPKPPPEPSLPLCDDTLSDEFLDTLEFLKAELSELMQRPNVVVIEWAEFLDKPSNDQSKNFLSEHDHVSLHFEHVNKNDSARIADIKGCGRDSSELVSKLTEKFGDMIICS